MDIAVPAWRGLDKQDKAKLNLKRYHIEQLN